MKHVIIIGKGNGWRDAPPLGADYIVWGVNDVICRRDVDAVFQMDGIEDYVKRGVVPQYEATLKAASEKAVPIYASTVCDESADVMQEYPLQFVASKVGDCYFSSSIDYMLALAIAERYDRIDLYGVLMRHHSEYQYQRPSAEYWIGFAKGRGIEVNIYGISSALCTMEQGKLYGYEKTREEMSLEACHA